MLSRPVALLVFGLVATACGGARHTEPRVVSVVAAEEVKSPPPGRAFVSVGTVIPLRIDETVGTDLNQPGDVFHATVTRSLYGTGRGGTELVVAAGARVTGIVAQANAGKPPLLALELRSIETTQGIAPLRGRFVGRIPARVESTAGPRTTASPYAPNDPAVSAYSNSVSPWEPGPSSSDRDLERVWIMAGSTLEVELTSPIAPVR